MAHPRMYSDHDPYLTELREICLALPEATEVGAWGRPTFRAGKIFATFSGIEERPYGVIFKPEASERRAILGGIGRTQRRGVVTRRSLPAGPATHAPPRGPRGRSERA